MAQIITVRILCDAATDSETIDGINEMLRTAQIPVENGDEPWIIDWEIGECKPASEDIDDSICNDTYAEGDFAN